MGPKRDRRYAAPHRRCIPDCGPQQYKTQSAFFQFACRADGRTGELFRGSFVYMIPGIYFIVKLPFVAMLAVR